MIVNCVPKARLFISDILAAGAPIALDGPQAHYLAQVMRAAVGECVLLFNGRNGEWLAEIADVAKKRIDLRVLSQTRPQQALPDHWLMFAPIKGDRVDWIAEKATELGVAALLPVKTERTVVGRVNLERLRARAIEAAEQCERLDVPAVEAFTPLEHWLGRWPADRRLILCDETGQGSPPDQALPPLKGQKTALLIGPEGGFAPTELERLRRLPYVTAITLGPRILRADTAALTALTCLQLFLGDWEKKPAFGAAREGSLPTHDPSCR